MSETKERIEKFLEYFALLKGDEKGEAQVFCDRLFKAFGHDGYLEAGAVLEYRIKKKSTGGTSFADLVWKPRLLIEMKKRGTNLHKHFDQAFEYWLNAVPQRPRYVVLCNFDEFWIYDFDKQIDEPIDILETKNLPKRYSALSFLFPHNPEPVFGNDKEAVSREAADKVAVLFKSLVNRGIDREIAQRFVLQLIVSMFAEDIDLLPANIVYGIVDDCLNKNQSSYDLFKGLFEAMDTESAPADGRFKKVPYFNGGLFSTIQSIELTKEELCLIGGDDGASRQDWSLVQPAIFGTIFQQSMDAKERHALGSKLNQALEMLCLL